MDLRDALHSLRSQQFSGTSGMPKVVASKRMGEVYGDSSSTPSQKTSNKVFQLDEVVKEDIDLNLSDDEFFQDAALLNLSDCDSPTDQPQCSSSLSPHTTSTQVSTATPLGSTSSTQTIGTPCPIRETVPSFKPLVSAQPSSQQQPKTSYSTSQRLRSFSFTKLPSRSRPANGSEENAAKRIALDISTTTVTSGTTSLLSNVRSNSSLLDSSTHPMHTPERSRRNPLSQRDFMSNSFNTPMSNTPQNTSGDLVFTPRSTAAASILTPTNRAVTPTSSHPARRKFPGPAGILPKLMPGQSMDSLKVVTPLTASPVSTPRARRIAAVNADLPSSQNSRQEFCQGPWVRILEEFDQDDSHLSVLLQSCIFNVIKQAAQRKLAHGKVPLLRAMIKSIVPTGKSASAVLKDPSGEVLASIHFKVMDEYQSILQPGCVLILQQTSVFSPSRCKHYLNVTLSNLVCVCPVDNTQQIIRCSVLDNSSLIQDQHQPVTAHHQTVTTHHQPVAAHHQPVTAHHQPVTAHHQPVAAHHQPVAAHHQPVTAHHQPVTAHHQPVAAHHQPVTAHHQPPVAHQSLTSQHQSLLHTSTTTSTSSDVCHRPYQLVEEIDEDEFDMLLKDMDDSFLNP